MGRTAGGAVAADLAQIVQHPLVEAAQLLQLPGGESPQHLLVYRVEDLGALLHRPAAPVSEEHPVAPGVCRIGLLADVAAPLQRLQGVGHGGRGDMEQLCQLLLGGNAGILPLQGLEQDEENHGVVHVLEIALGQLAVGGVVVGSVQLVKNENGPVGVSVTVEHGFTSFSIVDRLMINVLTIVISFARLSRGICDRKNFERMFVFYKPLCYTKWYETLCAGPVRGGEKEWNKLKQLTPKQNQIYDYILMYTRQRGYPPSVREIAAAVGLKSPSTVHFHLKAMEAAGVVTRGVGKTRSITLVDCEEPDQENRVPLLGSVAAGDPILAEQCVEDYLIYDTGGRSGEHFALRIRGDSMIDAGILPGDYVIVHRRSTAENGEIVIALLEDEATCKRVHWEAASGSRRRRRLWLMPENEEYQPIDGTCARILGKVVAVIRKYR